MLFGPEKFFFLNITSENGKCIKLFQKTKQKNKNKNTRKVIKKVHSLDTMERFKLETELDSVVEVTVIIIMLRMMVMMILMMMVTNAN